jgi:thymidylate synthase (FAD)
MEKSIMSIARLVSYSQPAEDFVSRDEVRDIQELVAYCARVSNPGNQTNSETASKLLKYMIKHKHWSPFEMVNVCMEITTTRDIGRQILRHRSFSFQEFSQRYADPTDAGSGLDYSIRECRLQDPVNRQNSIPVDQDNIEQKYLEHIWIKKQQELVSLCDETYKWAIKNGIAKEQARAVLPEGLTNSRMYINGTLRSWIHYIEVRDGNGTQKEHMQIAQECAKVIVKIFPLLQETKSE